MSMTFVELKLTNWIPYFGDQTLKFNSVHDVMNMSLIRGQNKGGKSAIIRAIKWVLYGDTGDVSEYQRPLELLNRDAKNNGDFKYSVCFILDNEGKRVEITRTMSVSGGISTAKDTDFNEELTIKVDRNYLFGDEMEGYVKKMLPRDISDFFLFDGEMLQQYKGLATSTTAAKKLKTQIEKVIKTPYIKAARDDMSAIKRDLLKAVKDRTDDKQIGLLLTKLEDLSIKEEEHSNSLELLENDVQTEEEEIKKIESNLRNYEEMIEITRALEVVKKRVTHTEHNIENAKNNMKLISSNAWTYLASTFIESRRFDLEKKGNELSKFIDENRTNDVLNTLYKESMSHCNLCNGELTPAQKLYIESKLHEYSTENTADAEAELKDIQQLLNKISNTDDLEMLRKQPNSYYSNIEQLHEYNIEIENLNKQANSSEQKDILDLMQQKANCENEKKQLNESIENIFNELNGPEGIRKNKTDVEILYSKLQKDKPIYDRNQSLLELCTKVERTLSETLENLIYQVREEIEEYANEMYSKMTVETSLTSLKINEGFGLDVLDANNEKITTSSAGNQIVAMSLLYGLKKATGLNGPLLIDTPFARVDLEHRQSMLNSYAEMTDQIILLVHSGEISEGGNLEKSIAKNIGARYSINKESDTNSLLIRI